MDIKLVPGSPSTIETECLVTIALDHGEKQQNTPKLTCLEQDAALNKAVAELIASGEITGKAFETVLLHSPSGLKAKRDRKSTRLNSSHQIISYAVFCLKKK